MYATFKLWMQILKQACALMIGIPDYKAYVKHQHMHHPDKPIMSYEAFFKDRQRSRYSSKKPGRCC